MTVPSTTPWSKVSAARATRAVSPSASHTFDQGIVDGTVNAVSSVSLFSGDRLRRLQTGIVTNYAALIALSVLALLSAFAVMGGWL